MKTRLPPLSAALSGWLALPGLLALVACNTAGFDVVSISPIYGWVDGCNTVRISGHGFAQDATATLGDLDLAVSARGEGIDEGYWLESVLPAAPVSAKGYATASVTSGGVTSTLPDAYYYVECPQPGNLESVDAETVVPDQSVTLQGCGLDSAALTVHLVPRAGTETISRTLTSACGTASATFTVPSNLTADTYDLQLVDATGAVVFPTWSCPAVDTADTAGAVWCPTLTYGADK